MGYSFRLAARVLLYAPSHRQDSTYHGLCYTSCRANWLEWKIAQWVHPTKDRSDDPSHHERKLLQHTRNRVKYEMRLVLHNYDCKSWMPVTTVVADSVGLGARRQRLVWAILKATSQAGSRVCFTHSQRTYQKSFTKGHKSCWQSELVCLTTD